MMTFMQNDDRQVTLISPLKLPQGEVLTILLPLFHSMMSWFQLVDSFFLITASLGLSSIPCCCRHVTIAPYPEIKQFYCLAKHFRPIGFTSSLLKLTEHAELKRTRFPVFRFDDLFQSGCKSDKSTFDSSASLIH